ncbi:hypothetical protein [Actinoallomurus vinaceus]|uniref:hypothetical protein n=1 Tax=Actinoallomurus vinaceus TaxID=1080074 RepID=UPI0031EBD5FF
MGDAMAAVVQGVIEVRTLIVGGLAVLSRLSSPYRATVDLDVVDRLVGGVPHLEVLRAADGAKPVEPAAVLLPTPYVRPASLAQIRAVDAAVAYDIALHVDLWFVRRRPETLHWIRNAAGADVTLDDLDLVAELLNAAAQRG